MLSQNDQTTSISNIPHKLTMGAPLYHDRCEFIELRQPDKHVSLLELPATIIANIRKLTQNKQKFRKTKQRIAFKQTAVDLRNIKQIQSMEMDGSEHVTNIRIGMLNARSIKNEEKFILESIRYNSSHRKMAARCRWRYHLDWVKWISFRWITNLLSLTGSIKEEGF